MKTTFAPVPIYFFFIAIFAQLTASAQPEQDSLVPWKKYEYVQDYLYEGLRQVGNNGKFGAVNARWKEVIPCQYDYFQHIENGYAHVVLNGKHGLIDTLGHTILPCEYDDIYYQNKFGWWFPDSIILLKKDEKKGLADFHGNILVPVAYEELNPRRDGQMIAYNGRACGVLTLNNREVLPFRFKRIYPEDYSSAIYVTRDSSRHWAAFDSSGKFIADGYDKMEYYNDHAVLVKCTGKWGVISEKGNIVLPVTYDSMDVNYMGNYIALKKEGKWGLADEKGNLLIPSAHDKIKYISEKTYAAEDSGKWRIFSERGAYELAAVYSGFGTPDNNGVLWVKRADRFGYINLYGKQLIPDTLTYPTSFHSDSLQFFSPPERSSHTHSETITESTVGYSAPGSFSQNRAVIGDGKGHYGFINKKGRIAIPAIYEGAQNFHFGLAAVKKNGHCGYIDTNGHPVVNFIYDEAGDFQEGLALVATAGKHGYINTAGKIVIPLIYMDAIHFFHGRASVAKDSAWGMINKHGKVVIPFLYNESFWFSEGLAVVTFNRKAFFIDSTGATAIADSSDFYCPFSNGMAISHNDSAYGFINTRGKLVIPYIYHEHPSLFVDGVASVTVVRHSKYGDEQRYTLINRQGRSILPGEYTFISNFTDDGTAVLKQFGDYAIINTSLKVLTPYVYEDVGTHYSEGLLTVKRGGKWGYIDRTGRTIIAHKYDKAMAFSEGLAVVQLNGKWGYINKTGKEVFWIEFPQ